MKDTRVYLTRDKRDIGRADIEVYPAIVGIRKFHGCLQYGAARWTSCASSVWANERGLIKSAKVLTDDACKKKYGFIVKPGEAWYVNEKGKRSSVDIAFSNKKIQ